MKDAIETLLVPWTYRKISHPVKSYFDNRFPLALTVAAMSVVLATTLGLFGSSQLSFTSEAGLVSVVNELLKFLIGFYVTSLTVVATFARAGLDEKMVGDNPPTLNKKAVTRRRFFSFLFGYLAFASIVLFTIGVVAKIFTPIILSVVGVGYIAQAIRLIFAAVFFYLAANILFTTLFGLQFLTDMRINRTPESHSPTEKPKLYGVNGSK